MNTEARHAMDAEKKLRQLIELAQDNQQAVQDAIACLVAEREALVKERAALGKRAVHPAEIAELLRRSAAEALPAMAAAAESAVNTSLSRAMGQTTDAAAQSWLVAANAVLDRFGSAARWLQEADQRARQAGRRHVWQSIALPLLGAACMLAVAGVAVQQIRRQQAHVEAQLDARLNAQWATQKAVHEDIARLQASAALLDKKGARMRLDQCGPDRRLCVEVSPDQGDGHKRFRGAWPDASHERSFVIPKGY